MKIMAGKDKGKTGKVSKVIPSEEKNNRRRNEYQEKEYETEEARTEGAYRSNIGAFYASNAMIICSSCGKTARTGYKLEGEKKIRVCKKCGNAA